MTRYTNKRDFGAVTTRFITQEEVASIPVLREIRKKWRLFTAYPNPKAEDWQNVGLIGSPVNVAQSAWRLLYMYRKADVDSGREKVQFTSLFKPGNWRNGYLLSECFRYSNSANTNHESPDEYCTCGVYATWNEWIVMQYVGDRNQLAYRGLEIVLAKVAPKAPYIPAEEGWRASGSQILELYTFECDKEKKRNDIAEYADPLGIPITDFSEKKMPKLKLRKK